MNFEWDDRENSLNIAKHGIDFVAAHDFMWHNAIVFDRSRPEDGEPRYAAVGFLNGAVHTIIFTRRGKKTRIISLRRANKMEERCYEKNT
jgi:uncharacterized DUF497 family protein